MMPGMTTPVDGWYPNPEDASTERWWYRGGWTEMVRQPGGGAAPPAMPPPVGIPTLPPPGGSSSRRRTVAWIAGVAAVALLAFGTYSYNRPTGTSGVGQPSLFIGGTATAVSVSITTSTGTSTVPSSSSSTIDLPSGESVYVQVQNSNADGGTVACRITNHAGNVVADNSAFGDYAVASCRGTT